MSATVAASLKKIAVSLLSNPKALKTVLGIVLGIILVIIMPIIIVISLFNGNIELNTDELNQQIVANMNDEQRAELQNFETVLISIETGLKTAAPDVDPIKAQVIYLCALSGREKDNEAFYSDYASCFVGVQNDDEIFANVTAKFGVSFTDDEKQKIITMFTKAIESQTLPPTALHNEIAELVKDDQTPLSEGDFLSPFHDLDWKSCVTSGYGKRTDPVTGKEQAAHTGIDLAAPHGTDIYPSKLGKVLFVRNDSDGYGNYLTVNHGSGYVTLYAHCSEILASEGDEVTADTVIARVGSTGKSTGDHCHFEIIIGGQPVNPKKYLR